MKNNILLLFACTMVYSASAQQILSKKGYPILPEKGEWSVGFDAVPFLQYAGNLFNGNNKNDAPEASYKKNNPYTFSGLYVKDENTAYRAKIRLGLNSTKTDTLVQNLVNPTSAEKVADEIAVIDQRGQALWRCSKGDAAIRWNGRSDTDDPIHPGSYIFRITYSASNSVYVPFVLM